MQLCLGSQCCAAPHFAIEPPLPLLVTGISGVAGYNVLPYLQARYPGQVIGIRQRDNWRLTGPGIEECNAEDRADAGAAVRQVSIRRRAGLRWQLCAEKLRTRSDNGVADQCRRRAESVRDLCAARRCGLCICRSIWFSRATGDGGHVETDPTDPVTVYGKTMVAAEEMILAAKAEGGRRRRKMMKTARTVGSR